MRHRRTTLGLATLTCLALAACSTQEPSEESGPDPSSDPSSDAAEDVGAGTVRLSEGPLGEQARWVLDALEPDADPSEEEVAARLSPTIADQVPAGSLVAALAQVRATGPYEVTEVVPAGDGALRLTLDGSPALTMTVAVGDDGLVTGLLFAPAPVVPDVSSYDELAATVEGVENVQVYVAEVTDGRCVETFSSPAEPVAAPSGSVFKLIVLSALVEAVEQGALGWDDELTVTAAVKSLPSGELQDRPDGSTVTVAEAAELMISISDNTATDLLMATLGTERVESWMTAHGLAESVPLMTTRQLFLLGWGAPEVRAGWADADAATRRDLLARLPATLDGLDPASVTSPSWTDGVEYFLTPGQVCDLHAGLQAAGDTEAGEPVRGILSANPGLVPPEQSDHLAFKGGSTPGVVALALLSESGDETRFYSMQAWDPTAAAIEPLVLGPAQAGLDLLWTS